MCNVSRVRDVILTDEIDLYFSKKHINIEVKSNKNTLNRLNTDNFQLIWKFFVSNCLNLHIYFETYAAFAMFVVCVYVCELDRLITCV